MRVRAVGDNGATALKKRALTAEVTQNERGVFVRDCYHVALLPYRPDVIALDFRGL